MPGNRREIAAFLANLNKFSSTRAEPGTQEWVDQNIANTMKLRGLRPDDPIGNGTFGYEPPAPPPQPSLLARILEPGTSPAYAGQSGRGNPSDSLFLKFLDLISPLDERPNAYEDPAVLKAREISEKRARAGGW